MASKRHITCSRFGRKLCPLPGKSRDRAPSICADIAPERFRSSPAEEIVGRSRSRQPCHPPERPCRRAIRRASSGWCVTNSTVMPPLGMHAGDQVEHVVAQRRAERSERLVEQQHRPVAHQHAGQRHALAFAAGQFARQALFLAGKAGAGERLGDCRAVGRRSAAAPASGRARHSARRRDGRTDCSPGTPSTPAVRPAAAPSHRRRRSARGRTAASRSRRPD